MRADALLDQAALIQFDLGLCFLVKKPPRAKHSNGNPET
jgi:hypothetical protein